MRFKKINKTGQYGQIGKTGKSGRSGKTGKAGKTRSPGDRLDGRVLAAAWCSVPLLLPSGYGVAAAQEPVSADSQSPILEEVLVSARRREESTMSVPAAVSAFGQVEIARYMTTDLKKIGEMVPQVSLAEASAGSGASFTIRGIGSASANLAIEQAVSLNIDGVQVGRGRFIKLGLLDLERVEVLKGPQALFFGKNSPAGVVSLTSVTPGTELEGYIRGGYEYEAEEKYLEAALTYPFSDTFRARVAVRGTTMEGWVTNRAQPIPSPYDPSVIMSAEDRMGPNLDEIVARITLVYEPSDNFEAVFKIAANRTERNTSSNAAQAVCADRTAIPVTLGLPDPFGDCKLDTNRSSADLPREWAVDWPAARGGASFMDQETLVSSLQLDYHASKGTLTSVTGWSQFTFDSMDDFAYASISSVSGSNENRFEQLSQEVRFVSELDGPLNFTVGGYLEDGMLSSITAAMLGYAGPDPATGRFYAYDRFGRIESRTYSLFGQLRWQPIDALEVALGARWTREEKDLVKLGHSFNHAAFAAGFQPVGEDFSGEFSDSDVSPEATLTYQLSDASILYGAYKTGYKSGGFSLPGNVARVETIESLEFDSETAEGFEIGYKSELLGRSMRLEVTAFHYEYDDLQVSSFDADTTRFIVRNAAQLKSSGVEASMLWQATNQLSLRSALGYSKAEYERFTGSSCYLGQTEAQGCVGGVQDLSGKAPPRAPDWSFNGGFTYDTDLTSTYSLSTTMDVSYVEGHNVQENANPVAFQESLWRLNASVRLVNEISGLELALIGRNLTNEFYMESSTDKPVGGPGESGPGLVRPREVALQATWRV
jgi:outer membrane receptor protein involved in Fe transport